MRGYWTDRAFGHSCAAPDGQTGELEYYCTDGELGITERDEEILHVDFDSGRTVAAAGPHLTPGFPSETRAITPFMAPLFSLPYVNNQPWPPVPIVVVGHFDDPRAADCRPKARKLCLDRFVLDRIAMFDPNSVPAPTPSPSPTPFPFSDPPAALFTDPTCYGGVPKSFVGWTTTPAEHSIQSPRIRLRHGHARRDPDR